MKIDEEFFWTDSQVVLGYINNEACRFHIFVANRVQLIRDNTGPSQWHYVDTSENLADHPEAFMHRTFAQQTGCKDPNFSGMKNCIHHLTLQQSYSLVTLKLRQFRYLQLKPVTILTFSNG